MEPNVESAALRSNSLRWDSHIGSENSTWLAENLEGVDQSVKQLKDLIEECEISVSAKTQDHYGIKAELIAHVEQFYRMHHLLADRYGNLTGELYKSFPSLEQKQSPAIFYSVSQPTSPLLTSDQKLGVHNSEHDVGLDLFFSSDGGSSDKSLKTGSASSSPLSWDSDAKSFNSSVRNHLIEHSKDDAKWIHQKTVEMENQIQRSRERIQVTRQDSGDYGRLNYNMTEYEQLKDSRTMIYCSEEEITSLKSKLKKNVSVAFLAGNLQAQLESADSNAKARECALEFEKINVLELQKQIADLETQTSDYTCRVRRLEEELELTREKHRASEEEIVELNRRLSNEISDGSRKLQDQFQLFQKKISLLEANLDSEKGKISLLQETILRCTAQLSECDNEILGLSAALRDAQQGFSSEKAHLQSDISSLLEQQALLKSRIGEWELRYESLESEAWQCQAEKAELRVLHEAREMNWQTEIERSKAESDERGEQVEALNKCLDELKLKYDMQTAEKDGLKAKVHTLLDDLCSRDCQIKQIEDCMFNLNTQREQLIGESESGRKLTDELRSMVEELEKEVDRQRAVISDRAQEKREAIRQLCFSLDHYRSGYQELRRALVGHKRHAAVAS